MIFFSSVAKVNQVIQVSFHLINMSWSLITVGTDTDWLLSSAFSRRWNTDRFMECFPVSCDVAGEVEGSGPLQKQSRVSSRTRQAARGVFHRTPSVFCTRIPHQTQFRIKEQKEESSLRGRYRYRYRSTGSPSRCRSTGSPSQYGPPALPLGTGYISRYIQQLQLLQSWFQGLSLGALQHLYSVQHRWFFYQQACKIVNCSCFIEFGHKLLTKTISVLCQVWRFLINKQLTAAELKHVPVTHVIYCVAQQDAKLIRTWENNLDQCRSTKLWKKSCTEYVFDELPVYIKEYVAYTHSN